MPFQKREETQKLTGKTLVNIHKMTDQKAWMQQTTLLECLPDGMLEHRMVS